MLDKNKLKAKMTEYGYTNATLSNEIGISSRTFSNRLKTGDFGADEIKIIIDKLKIADPVPIFFA